MLPLKVFLYTQIPSRTILQATLPMFSSPSAAGNKEQEKTSAGSTFTFYCQHMG